MTSDPPPTSAPGRLGTATKLLYGSGTAAFGAKAQIFGLLLLYYNQIVGLPAHWVSVAFGASMIIDAIWDPMIGELSDRLRSPWGRRHPLMYLSAAPIALSFAALWIPPAGWSEPALLAYIVVLILVVRLATSLFEVPNLALAPELAPNYHDRTVLIGYRWLFQTLGSAVAAILAFGVFLRATPEYPMGQLNPAGYAPLGLSVAALMFFAVIVSALGTHHRIPTLHRPPVRRVGFGRALLEVAATLRNWNFAVVVTSGLIGGLANGLMVGLTMYFNTYFWELPALNILLLVLVSLVATPIAALIAPLLSRAWGKRNACMAMFAVAVLTNGAPIFLRLVGFFPENGAPTLVPLLMGFQVVTGALGIGGYILSVSMTADIVEEMQLRTGRRSEGLLLSAESLLNKMVTGLGAALPGIVLAVIAFPENAKPGAVDPAVLERLGWVYIPAVTVLAMASVFVRAFYRIDQAAHERNQASLRESAALAEAPPEGVDAAPGGANPVAARI